MKPLPPIETPVFWLVWRSNTSCVTQQHGTRESAEAEAKRLSSNYPGDPFFVMKVASVYCAQVTPVTRGKITAADPEFFDNIPF